MNLNHVSHTPAAWQSTAHGASEQDTKKFVQAEADKLFVSMQQSGWGSTRIAQFACSIFQRATQCAPFPSESIPDSTYRKAIDFFKNKLGYHDEKTLLIKAAGISFFEQVRDNIERFALAEIFEKDELAYIARKHMNSPTIDGIQQDYHCQETADFGFHVLEKIKLMNGHTYDLATFLNKLNPSLKFPDFR
ncbi:hypothetical protein [Endozoicomonas sp. SCSIO W0465]|uniref:hypothetical protein n=1 Tax=Endozoicomonas sp. SCSIO W0465 TaxID=2918516 RepID=UPI002075E2BD|nr:hypothetical protein [Endozoicomonas sp. SCSIO W0465]USE37311.1 hypothetical protein MJO57_03530 [Endozoicomonas sp. SCSIO W0465]